MTLKRYGAPCSTCGILRDYHRPSAQNALHAETVQNHPYVAAHVCNMRSPWPIGHPLPAEDPAKLRGPELGFAIYHDKYTKADVVVRVIERSYVWSPGECRSNGGRRRYDWSVIERGPDRFRAVVVNDTDLSPLPEGAKAGIGYVLR